MVLVGICLLQRCHARTYVNKGGGHTSCHVVLLAWHIEKGYMLQSSIVL